MKTINRGLRPLAFGLVMIVGALGISGCSIDDSVNQSPNGISSDRIKSRDGMLGVLVALQSVSGDFYSGDRSRVNSIWAWQMAGTGQGRQQPVGWNSYVMDVDGPTNDNWLNGYRGVKLANDILTIAPTVNFGGDNDKARATIMGIAEVYKAMIFGELAATYGSIPIEIDGFTPAQFVSQSQAYDEVQRLLSSALARFDNATTIQQDLNFQGDGAKWKAVIHSLKARYFLHVKKYAEALNEVGNGIADPTGNLMAIYTDNPNEVSPWGHWTGNEGEPIKVEKTYMDLLKSEVGDKRLDEYFNKNADGNYLGFAAHGEAGATADEMNPDKVSGLKKYSQFADDFPFITYEENVLIRAECEARVGALPNAVTAVNVIRTEAGLPDFASTDKDATIAEILKQKDLQLFLEGQTYTDQRRTGTTAEPNVPKRWIYPSSEKNANPNTPADNDALVNVLVGP
ncbi:MAG TPA: SusD/RagB family nutrient-binding outer membrane lipoprotein [Candidatus Kapabacteria bacterium]|nr:SusD/RagB family nutrient-binding outer membrane lipoprotein [Candidatus Kapabacteria bacterium]